MQLNAENRPGATWLFAAILLAVGALIYVNTLHVPFYFDDIQNIRDNNAIRITNLSLSQLADVVEHAPTRNRPLANLSFALNYFFHQDRLPGYHLVNIAIHLAAALLLFQLLATTFSLPAAGIKDHPRLLAFLAALLWLAHPIQTQAVTYLVQRMTSLAAMLSLLALFSYVRGRVRMEAAQSHRGWFCAAALTWGLALAAKETAITLPVFIFLYEFFFFRDLDRDWLRKTIPWGAAVLVIVLLTGYLYTDGRPLETIRGSFHYRDFSLPERLLTESRVIFFYISLLLLPHPSRLSLDHDFVISHGLTEPLTTLPAMAGLLALLVLACAIAKQERLISFALLWFLGNLFLESSFIGLEPVFEHRLYLPSAFPLALLPAAAVRPARLRPFLCIGVAAIIALCSFWTYQRNQTWREPIAFYQDIAAKAPGKSRPHYNLGMALTEAGRYPEAISEFSKALQLDSRLLMAHSQLAHAYAQIGRIDLALLHYGKVLATNPGDAQALAAIGVLYGKQGDLATATAYLQQALRIAPDNPGFLLNMGIALHRQGALADAMALYRKALRLAPDNAQAYNNIALILFAQGEYPEAAAYLQRALAVDPRHQEAQRNLEALGRFRPPAP